MKNKNTNLFTLIFVGAAMLLTSCSETDYFSRRLKRSSRNIPTQPSVETPIDIPLADIPEGGDLNLNYFQVSNQWTQTGKIVDGVEIAFVVDVSGSMQNDINAVKNSLEGWVATLRGQGIANYCLGVIAAVTEDTRTPWTPGMLVSGASHNKKCVCTYGDNNVSVEEATKQFRETLDTALVAKGGTNEEASIYSATKALDQGSDVYAQNQAAGCFRNDVPLALVLVQDENTLCYAPNASDGYPKFKNDFFLGDQDFLSLGDFDNSPAARELYNRSFNDPLYGGIPDNESDARKKYCTSGEPIAGTTDTFENIITHQNLSELLQGHNGDLPSFATAIGYQPGKLNNYAQEPFWGGNQLAESFGYPGVDINLTQESQELFNQGMNQMAKNLGAQVQHFDSFSLTDEICDVNQDGDYVNEEGLVTVTVDEVEIPNTQWSIAGDGKGIVFDQSFEWTTGDAILVSYIRCEA